MSDESRARRLVRRMSYVERAAVLQALREGGDLPAGKPTRPWLSNAPRVEPGPLRIADQPSLTSSMALFDSAAWQAVWRPGADFHIYVVGCSGLARLAARMDLSLAKAGTCAVGDLDRRLGALNGQAYGGVVRRSSRYTTEPGWSDWTPFAKLQLGPTPPACPVRASARSLVVTAPRGWTPGEVESTVNEALAPYRLQHLADSDAGRLICGERGVDPAALGRYSRKGRRVVAATELTLIRPRVDAPMLAGLVTVAIARRLRAVAPNPNATAWQVLGPPVSPAVTRHPAAPARQPDA